MKFKKITFTLLVSLVGATGLMANDISIADANTFAEANAYKRCYNALQPVYYRDNNTNGKKVPGTEGGKSQNQDYKDQMNDSGSQIGDTLFDNVNFQSITSMPLYKQDTLSLGVQHLSRNPLKASSLGSEFFTNFDMKIELTDGLYQRIMIFDPALGQSIRLERKWNISDMEFRDYMFGRFYLKLFDVSGNEVNVHAQAVTAQLTTREGHTFDFEFIDLGINNNREGRLTNITSNTGLSIDVNYQSFTQTEIDASPELQWVMSDVTNGTQTIAFDYKDDGLGNLVTEQGYYVIAGATLPNNEVIDFQYGVDGLSNIDLPTGVSKIFNTTIETNGLVRMDFDNKSIYYKNAVDASYGKDATSENDYYVATTASKLPAFATVDGEVVYMVSANPNALSGWSVQYRRIYENGTLRQLWSPGSHAYYEDWELTDPTQSYNGFSNLTLESTYDDTADSAKWTPATVNKSDGTVIDYEYYNDGSEKKKTYSDGSTEEWEYDEFLNWTMKKDRNDNVRLRTYSSTNKLLSEEKGLTMVAGVPTPVTGEYFIRTNTYDVNDKLQFEGDFNGNQIEYVYNGSGQLIEKKEPTDDGTGQITFATYTHTASGKVATVTDALGVVTTNSYDELDNLIVAPETPVDESNITRDHRGRIVAIDHGLVLGVSKIQTFTYQDGMLFCEDDGFGWKTYYAYRDSDKKLIREVRYKIPDITLIDFNDVLGLVPSSDYLLFDYEFDDKGNNTARIINGVHRKEYQYNSQNKQSKIIFNKGTIGEYSKDFEYNGERTLSKVIDSNGDITLLLSTSRNRRSSIIEFEGTTSEIITNFSYENDGSQVDIPVLAEEIPGTIQDNWTLQYLDGLADDLAIPGSAEYLNASNLLFNQFTEESLIDGVLFLQWVRKRYKSETDPDIKAQLLVVHEKHDSLTELNTDEVDDIDDYITKLCDADPEVQKDARDQLGWKTDFNDYIPHLDIFYLEYMTNKYNEAKKAGNANLVFKLEHVLSDVMSWQHSSSGWDDRIIVNLTVKCCEDLTTVKKRATGSIVDQIKEHLIKTGYPILKNIKHVGWKKDADGDFTDDADNTPKNLECDAAEKALAYVKKKGLLKPCKDGDKIDVILPLETYDHDANGLKTPWNVFEDAISHE